MENSLTKLVETRSPFQKVALLNHQQLGQQLWLDDEVAACESDQSIAEAILQPLAQEPNLKHLIIASSAHGNLVGSLLRCQSAANQFEALTSVRWIERDIEVIRLCQQFPTRLNNDLYEHPLLKIIIGDASSVIKHADRVDGIVWDSPLPSVLPPLSALSNSTSTDSEDSDAFKAFFKMIRKHLMPGGWLSFSSDLYSKVQQPDLDSQIADAITAEFDHVETTTVERKSTQKSALIYTARKAIEN